MEPIVSNEMSALLKHLKKKGILEEVLTKRIDKKDLSVGSYRPGSKSLAVIADRPDSGDSAIAHELVHVFQKAGIKPNSQKAVEYEKEYRKATWPWQREESNLPRHWVEGRMDSAYNTDRQGSGRIPGLAQKAIRRRFKATTEAIPKGESWSGLKNPKEKKGYWDGYVEGNAYYYTDGKIASPGKAQRNTEFGMMLLDYGVPMELVEPLVKRLKNAEKLVERYSGGSYELNELRKSKGRR